MVVDIVEYREITPAGNRQAQEDGNKTQCQDIKDIEPPKEVLQFPKETSCY
jgi:hypothetical protein